MLENQYGGGITFGRKLYEDMIRVASKSIWFIHLSISILSVAFFRRAIIDVHANLDGFVQDNWTD